MEITSEIVTAFRAAQPAFSNTTTWPDALVTAALNEGAAESGGKRWGIYQPDPQNVKARGMYLFAAHWLSSMYPKGGTGAVSGGAKWVTGSKSVGDESTSNITGNVITIGDAWLATTTFGQQFIRLRRRVGMGALAV